MWGPRNTHRSCRLLVVENEEADFLLVEDYLSGARPVVDLHRATRLSRAIGMLQNERFDLVVLDLGLPDSRGVDTLRAFREVRLEQPFIVVTGQADEAVAIESIRAGAEDCLIKGELTCERFQRAVRLALERSSRATTEASASVPHRSDFQRLRRSAKMAGIRRLAGGMAHELNNLLVSVMSHAELIKGGVLEGEESKIAGESIFRASERASELTRRLLGFSGQGKLVTVPVEMGQLLERARLRLAKLAPSDVGIHLHRSTEEVLISGDPGQLLEIFVGLGLNSIEAMPEGGRLELSYGLRGESILVRFEDTGPGIAKEDMERIFEPFFSTKPRGVGCTGFGLPMTFGIMEAHDGEVQVESSAEGTTILLSFPRPELGPSTDAPQTQPQSRGKGLILIIDDEAQVREVVERVLGKLGYRAMTAGSAEEGLEIFSRHSSEITLVLLDILMPGMTGEECLPELRKLDPGVPVVVATGFNTGELTAQVDGVLRKPFSVKELIDAVSGVQNRSATA